MAAAIGVGGTVIVGVAGYSAAIWTTRRTIQQARDTRMWDKRAEVYVDALAAVHWRQAIRERDMRNCRLSDEEDQPLKRLILGSYKMPDPYQLRRPDACVRIVCHVQGRRLEGARDAAGLHVAANDDAADSAQAARRAADDAR